MKNLLIGLLVVLLGVSTFNNLDVEMSKLGETSDTNLVVEEYQPKVVKAFDTAEKKFIVKPEEEEIARPHPDAKKCPCKGSGWMPTDGGNVRLECEYHGPSVKNKQLMGQVEALQKQLEEAKAKTVKEAEAVKAVEQAKAAQAAAAKAAAEPKYVRKNIPRNTLQKQYYQVVMFIASWCGPCQQFKQGPLKEYYDKVKGVIFSNKPSADFRILNIEDERFSTYYMQMREGNRALPLFVEIENNVVLDRKAGISYVEDNKEKPMDFEYLINRYDFEDKK